MSVTVRGLKALEKKVTVIDRKLGEEASKAAKESAQQVAERAKDNLVKNGSYRSGELYESVTISRSDEQLGFLTGRTARDWRAGTNKFYGRFVEFGTVKQSAKPFLWPAWESLKDEIRERIFRARLRDVIRSAAR